jgi:carbonic anhydrase/acetyltransferase-like protein (isoleucine patch superfamily)
MIHQLGDKTVVRDGHNWIADSAKVIGNVHLKNESSVWFGAVLRGDIEKITLGEGSNIQDNSVIHTDPGCPANIGSGVTIGHLVMLHGCTIKDDSLIGIGSNCIIGANTLITEKKEIPDNSLVMGTPGKIIRQLDEKEILEIKENAERYINNWKNYKKNFK